ncbi:MAG: iron-containing redox enzyme family protein [Bdellovibrionaceae bacterium]|nr:iron-containing redox enzyme family protein [Pseudobdellovibrionaceae bacterium]
MKIFFYQTFELYQNNILKNHWEEPKAYANYLAQTFYYVSHSSRIMSIVAGHLPMSQEDTHKAILQHASEERGHQFAALKDLERMGFNLKHFPELPETRMFWEPQYFKAQFSPLDFYGYALMLEGTAVLAGPKILEKIEKAHGPKPCGFIRLHCQEDPAHLENIFKLFDTYTSEQKLGIQKNCQQSFIAFTNMLNATMGDQTLTGEHAHVA